MAICAAWPSTSTCSCAVAQDDLVEVIDKKPELLGLGLDEPAAVVVQGDRLEVIGRSVVGIYDGKDHDGKKYYLPGTRRTIRPAVAQARGEGTESPATSRLRPPRSRLIPPRPRKPRSTRTSRHMPILAWEMARKIWDWAEVGYQEKRSSALLADAMEAGGFRVERGVAGIPTSFIATHWLGQASDRDPGRVRRLAGAFAAGRARAPGSARRDGGARLRPPSLRRGLGHGVLWRSASRSRPARSRARLRFYGCPAEEGGSAKAFMVRAHLFDDCDAVLHWHPGSQNSAGDGSSQARIAVKFRFHGTSSHAAAAPELGRSALDAIELTNHAAELLREHTPDFTRIHHVVTAGGSAPNVVPDFGEVFYYIRHPRSQVVQTLYPRLLKCAEAGALATETRLETQYLGGILEILPNETLGRVARANLSKLNDLKYDDEETGSPTAFKKPWPSRARLKSLRPHHGADGAGG